MKTIYAFFRQQMKMRDYYIGTIFWALGVLLSEIGKAKKDLVDSGLASEDSKEPLLYSMVALLLLGIAAVFSLRIMHHLRKFFTRHHPNNWNFGLSVTWAGIKYTVIILLTMIPGIIYVVANIQRIMIDPAQSIRVVGIAMLLQALFLPVWLVVGFGTFTITILRGTAYRSTRDSFQAFKHVWKEALLGCLLMAIPTVLILPVRFLSLKFTSLEYVAMVLSVFMAPYTFGIIPSVYLYLGKLLSERAPAMMDADPAAGSVVEKA